MQQWYALHTKPHAERQVEETLRQRNIEAYLPILHVKTRRGRSSIRPFFPRYLFARADLDEVGLWSLHYMPGMRGVVMFGGVPATVDERVIEHIRERLAQVDVVDKQGEILESGDRVRIVAGPFMDLEAIFDRRLSAQGRVRVLIELIQRWNKSERWMKVDVDAEVLRKIR